MKIKLDKEFFVQAVKYGFVGGINTLITWSVYSVMYIVLKIDWTLSYSVGFFLGFINSLILNTFFTFGEKRLKLKESLIFTLIFIVFYSITYSFSKFVLIDIFRVGPNISFLIGSIIYTGLSFIANKVFNFRKKD